MKKKKALGVCVQLSQAEPVRKFLRERQLLREDLVLKKDEESIYFPIKEITEDLKSYTVVTVSFEEKKTKPRLYKDLLNLPDHLRAELPTSYDIIGDIILMKIPKTLLAYQKKIGEALLRTHTNIRTVCVIDPVAGELRTRNVTVIAGENRTLTTHTEYGLSFDVDVSTTYFSPRLASERKRVTSLVKPGETVVDMFAGVAPFSIMIARYAQPKIVYAIDKNKEAVRLAKQNVKQNHVLETVEVLHADAKNVKQVISTKADRIIMNLPFSAHAFFSSALGIANDICIIHYYDIVKEEEIERRIDALKKIAKEQRFILTDYLVYKIKSYAPREFYIGIDITARNHADVA